VAEILSAERVAASMQRIAFDLQGRQATFRHRVLAYEKYLIESCLLQHEGKVAPVLEALQINRRTLNDKMNKLGIRRQIGDDSAG